MMYGALLRTHRDGYADQRNLLDSCPVDACAVVRSRRLTLRECDTDQPVLWSPRRFTSLGVWVMSRRALVIGNSQYVRGPLANPRNDADAIASELAGLNFEIVKGVDLGRNELHNIIADFSDSIAGCEAVAFFYAGHGMQVDGENYILPIDANITAKEDIPRQTISLNRFVLPCLDAPVRLIFLDACRNNPFVEELARAMGRDLRGPEQHLDLRHGLASMRSGGGKDTFISFATEPDSTAADIDSGGKHSPYTRALLTHIGKPHRTVFDIIGAVGADVRKATSGRQIPWFQSSLQLPFYFLPPPVISADERWSEIGDAKQPARLRAFIEAYPHSEHVLEALKLLRGQDDQEWADAQLENSEEAYRFYLLRWPDGLHRTEAQGALETLITARRDRDWEEVRAQDTIEGYEGYLSRCDGPHTDAANNAIEELKDKMVFEAAQRANDLAAYEDYLKQWPQGRSARKAREAISLAAWNALMAAKRDKTVEACDQFLQEWPKGRCRDSYRDDIAWLRASLKNTSQAYEDYLQTFPSGEHCDAAFWECARSINTVQSYSEYLERSENGAFRGQALWLVTCLINTREAYEHYLEVWPEGEHWQEAESRLDDVGLPDSARRTPEDYRAGEEFSGRRQPSGEEIRAASQWNAIGDSANPPEAAAPDTSLPSSVSRPSSVRLPRSVVLGFILLLSAAVSTATVLWLVRQSEIKEESRKKQEERRKDLWAAEKKEAERTAAVKKAEDERTAAAAAKRQREREEKDRLAAAAKKKADEEVNARREEERKTAEEKARIAEAKRVKEEAIRLAEVRNAEEAAARKREEDARAEAERALAEENKRRAQNRPQGKPVLPKELPSIRVSDISTGVPSCVTTDRLDKFLDDGIRARPPARDLNGPEKEEAVRNVKARFPDIAKQYESVGQTLQVRWDLAFFHMVITTNYLTFTGRVRSEQNNLSGLGVTQTGSGETFPDGRTGVRVDLEYLLLMAGEKIPAPATDYLRKIQTDEIKDPHLEIARKRPKPITFSVFEDREALWAKAKSFYDAYCN
jgi:uncharacterized caspase-like protein